MKLKMEDETSPGHIWTEIRPRDMVAKILQKIRNVEKLNLNDLMLNFNIGAVEVNNFFFWFHFILFF
jgi:hypothetical protein